MSTEPQDVEEIVVEEQEVDTPEVETEEITEVEEADGAEETPEGDTTVVADETPIEPEAVQQAPQQPQVDQQAINELRQRREADSEREWKEAIGQRARSYEQSLLDSGYMQEQARDQARRYIQQEQKFRKQERESSDMLGFLEGRHAAAQYFLKKYGLANQQMLDDYSALQSATTPQEMEKEAKRMKRERALIAENARLKQGRVTPQTFDNSQGSAEVTTNQERLLEAYINGDRSEAAVKAARLLTLGK
jgi:hypothetical protein